MVAEELITERLTESFTAEGKRVFREVPMLSRSIDLVVLDEGQLVAIEAKVKDWRRALRQAIAYQTCADRVYIAMWHEYAHRADVEKLSNHGVGLISVSIGMDVILPAIRTDRIHTSVRDAVIKSIERIGTDPEAGPA